jgi:hypothetical protein
VTDAAGSAGSAREPATPWVRELVGALIVYFMLAYIFTASAWADPSRRWVGICCDQEQSIWFLAWLPTALQAGHNPLFTDRLNAPHGANLMWNSSVPLLGLLVAPITRLGGPILAYNVAALVAIALSGLACFAALRRYTKRALGPLVGGALYGLSPFVASHTALHLNLINAWAPPLFLIILDELLARRRYGPIPLGVALGVLGAVQLVTAEEILAMSAVVGALLALVLALVVRDRETIVESGRRMLQAAVPGLAAFLLVGGLPLAAQFLGPQQVHGRVQDTSVYSTDLLNVILPTPYQFVAPEIATDVSRHFSGLYHEATGYVGLPLLLVLAWFVARRWSDPRVRVAAVLGLVLLVLSLGPELHVAGEPWHVPMPWAAIGSLPLIEHVLPGRLTLFMWIAVAALVAITVDQAGALQARSAGIRLAAIGLALAFVLPTQASSSTTEIPQFFRAWDQQGIDEDAVVLFAPWFTNGAGADPMLWAAFAEARPRMYEGYVYVPDSQGHPRYGPAPGPLANLMIDVQDHGVLSVLSADDREAAARELADAGISVVILGPMQHRVEMVALFTDLFGRPPVEAGGVEMWSDVQGSLAGLRLGG